MECAPVRSQAWLDEHEADLIGMPGDEAASLIEGAGLIARTVPHRTGRLTPELRGDRVTLRLAQDGTVGATDAG